jgi:hypothetical protein
MHYFRYIALGYYLILKAHAQSFNLIYMELENRIYEDAIEIYFAMFERLDGGKLRRLLLDARPSS